MIFVSLCVCARACVGEVTAEELRQRLDGAKERVSSQPPPESRPQNSEAGQEGSSGELKCVWLRLLYLQHSRSITYYFLLCVLFVIILKGNSSNCRFLNGPFYILE